MGSLLSPAIASALRSSASANAAPNTVSFPASGTPTRAQALATVANAILSALPGAGSATGSPGTASSPQSVARVVAASLNSTGSSGLQPLLDSIHSAVAGALTTLTQSGLSATAADNLASDFLTQLSQQVDAIAAGLTGAASTPTTGAPAAPASGDSGSAPAANGNAAAAGGIVSLTESGSVRLLLQDGSAVSIRLRNQEGASLNVAEASGGGALAAYAAASSFSSGSFSVSVQGSLSAADQKAIGDVLSQVDTLASQFFSGNFAQAFATGAALSIDPTEIARVSIRFSETASVRFASLGSGDGSVASGTAAPTAPAAPAGTGASDAASTTGAGAVGAGATAATPVPGAASAAGPAAPPAGAATASSALDAMFAYLNAVVAALGSGNQIGAVTLSARAKLTLLAGAVSAQSISPQEAAGAGFLKRVTASA
jgi:hypothetical protein